jgi:hypothetical protein
LKVEDPCYNPCDKIEDGLAGRSLEDKQCQTKLQRKAANHQPQVNGFPVVGKQKGEAEDQYHANQAGESLHTDDFDAELRIMM